MSTLDSPDTLAALALVPEQLPAYVRTVAGSSLCFCQGFAVYLSENDAVLAGYPTAATLVQYDREHGDPALERAIAEISDWPNVDRLHVLAPVRPATAPVALTGYHETRDTYLCIDLPAFSAGKNFNGIPSQKLRNMLRRADRECNVTTEAWSEEFQELANSYGVSRSLEAGTRYIFEHLAGYAATDGVRLFAARSKQDSSLQGFCLGDFTSLATAFYMFAFCRQENRQRGVPRAIPGTADLLLHTMLDVATQEGYERVNLGLSINSGIGFFKEKWGAKPFLPLVECSWPLKGQKKSFWRRLLHGNEDSKKVMAQAQPEKPTGADPLHAPHLRSPGMWESVRDLIRGEPRLFDVLQIEVSSSCMARCTYCPRSTMHEVWKSSFMNATTFANAWPLFRQARRVHLQGWGEPLLHPRFFDFVELARRADCQVSTTTCGLVMDERIALQLVESGVDIIAFSLAGVDAQGNRSRGEGTFQQATDAIRLLQSIRKKRMAVHLEIHLAYMVLASQIDDLHGLPALLDELDVHAAVVSTMDYIPSPDMAGEAFMPWEREKIARARKVLGGIAAKATAKGRSIFYSLPEELPQQNCLEHIGRSLYIASDGAVSPCIYVNLPVKKDTPLRRIYGNVNRDAPLAIWHRPEYAAFRQGLLEGTPDANCLDCPKRFAVGNRQTVVE